jgi:LysR family transcriptional activator of glutamate synthase operon
MELFQLKYFLAVAKYEHVTKAAESLHIAQPAVSQAIRHLEEEFDTPLFDRENRHITLNATGKMLQKRLTPIMAALDAIPDEIKEAAQQNQPVIHLNLRSASSVITNCIIAYREIHPEVKFRLSQKPDDPVADYFISATGLDTELKPSQRVLFTEEFYLAVPLHRNCPTNIPYDCRTLPQNHMSAWKKRARFVRSVTNFVRLLSLSRTSSMKATARRQCAI